MCIFVVLSKKTNGRLGITSNCVCRRQKTNANLDATLNFLIWYQKERDCFETILKISYFVVKE